MRLRHKIAIALVAFLMLAVLGFGGKKGIGGAAGRIVFHDEMIIADGAIGALPIFTSSCLYPNNHLTRANTGANGLQRCYVGAGEEIEFIRFSATATNPLNANEDCSIGLYFTGVLQAWTTVHVGSTSTLINTTCESLDSVGGDGRIDTSNDSCTQINTDKDSSTVLSSGYYLIGVQGNSDCQKLEAIHVAIDGFIHTL